MITLARLTIGVLLALLGTSCQLNLNWGTGVRGNGNIVSENRNISESFTVVSASEGMHVFVAQGPDFEIIVEADENIQERIGTDIRDGELRVHAIEPIGRATRNIYVTLPEITGLNASSGSDLEIKGLFNVERLRLDASSGADIVGAVEADEINANCSSGADIRISGKTNILHAQASSGSDIKAGDLIAETCKASASSGADIEVYVTEFLEARASSGADIRYGGNGQIQSHKSSAGHVKRR